MLRIIDTYKKINTVFENGTFHYAKWEAYINSIYPNSAHIFKDEIDEYINTGKYTFENDFLPILNEVYNNPMLEVLHNSFSTVVTNLNKRIIKAFGRELNVDIVLYLGLCNAAGWVTKINGEDTVLLGVEKIIELNWCDTESMYSLIYHELGHVYQEQYGILEQTSEENAKNFVWQLFIEGIAMYFEQVLVGDLEYFHQDKDGWKTWCDENFTQILKDFDSDLPTMTQFEQRYFGDWCNYCGHSDVGYYLGNKFVHFLLKNHSFDELIGLHVDDVYELYIEWRNSYL